MGGAVPPLPQFSMTQGTGPAVGQFLFWDVSSVAGYEIDKKTAGNCDYFQQIAAVITILCLPRQTLFRSLVSVSRMEVNIIQEDQSG
jgi:hypothetical protein